MPGIRSTTTDATTHALLKDVKALLEGMKSQNTEGLDISERIQQQLAQINDESNLEPGERHYD